MDFGSNFVVAKIPNLMNFGLSPANTPGKIKYVIVPTTRVGRLTNGSVWIRHRHDIEEFTAERVSEEKVYSDYILKTYFGTMKDFERENISRSGVKTISPSKL